MMTAEPKYHILPRPARLTAARLEALYRRWSGPLYAYLLAQCGRRHDAEDLLQQCFLKAAAAGAGMRDEQAYLFTTARNLLTDHYRRAAHRPQPGVAADFHLLPARPDAEDRVTGEALATALGRLSDADRELLVLKYYSGLTLRQMEDLLSVPRSTLQDKLQQALAALRAELPDTD